LRSVDTEADVNPLGSRLFLKLLFVKIEEAVHSCAAWKILQLSINKELFYAEVNS